MTEERKIQLVAEVDTTRTRAGFAEIGQQAGNMGANVNRAGQQANNALNNIGNGAQTSAQRVESAQRNLIGSIQRTTAAMETGTKTGSAYYEALARQRGIDPAILAPYLAQLKAVEAAQARANAASGAGANSMDRLGTSAAQTAAALRGVPAQFTDIVTALQGGQAPLTVLLQQGGQLKDTFGGLGEAAKGLGGYVLGLVNPFTIVAAVVAVLGVAYHQGASEAKAYARTLALTGNAAGTTKDQLADMAREIGKVSGSQGAAAEALTALAGTGRVSVENLKRFGAVAVDVQKIVGRSVADTAADFASLGKAPLTALDQINEKYHFITASTYAQVKAMLDQGRAADAAKLAQNAYADAIASQKDRVLATLTDWERGWIRIKEISSKVVDGAIDLAMGRQATNILKITDALAERELIEKRIAVAVSKGDAAKEATFRADLDRNKAEINALRGKDDAQKEAAKAEAASVIANAAKNKWLTDNDKYLTRAAQLTRDLRAAENEGAAAGKSPEEVAARQAGIRKAYADVYAESVDKQLAALKRFADVEEAVAKKSVDQINFLRAAGSITEDDAINQLAKSDLTRFDRDKKMAEAELALAKQKQNSLKEQIALQSKLDVLSVDRSARVKQQENDLFLLEQKRARAAAENYANLIEGATGQRDALQGELQAQIDSNAQLGMTKVELAALTAARLIDLAVRKESDAEIAEGLDLSGKLAETYRDQAQALRERASALQEGAAKEVRLDEWKKAVDQYGDVFRTGFADMLNNGKDGWKSFTKSLVTTFKTSVADQIYKMFAQPFVMKLVASLIGATGGSTLSSAAQAIGGGGAGDSALGNATSLLSAGKTLYAGFSSGLVGGLGSLATSVGSSLGISSLAGFGGGLSAAAGGGTSGAAMAAWASSSGNLAAGASSGIGAAGAIPIVGWIAAGMALSNNLYKKGWDADNGSMNGVGNIINATTNTLLQKIGLSNSLANMLSGASTVSRLFGRKNPEITDQGLSGTFNASGFAGEKYANILEKGGVFRSDKKYSETYSVGDQLDGTFDQTIKNLLATVQDFGKAMGVETSQIDGYTKQIKLSLGADQAKNDELIAGMFGEIGNDLARLLIPTIDSLSKSGEAAAATLQRLGTDYVVIDEALAAMGDTFGAVGIGSLSARERLVELAGGLDAFSKGAAYFAQNYLSQAEQTEALAKKVGGALSALGLSGISTREQFKNIVLGLDLTTESGAATYAGLMNIQEAFAALNPTIDTAAKALELSKSLRDQEIQMMELTGDKAGALAASRALELEGMDAALVPGQKRINQLKDEAGAREDSLTRSNSLLAIQAQIYELTGDKAGAAAVLQKQHVAALNILDPALRAATERLYGLEAAANKVQGAKNVAAGLVKGADDAFAVLQRIASAEKARTTEAHNLEMARLQESIDAETTAMTTRKAQANANVQSTKALSDAIRASLDQMRLVGNEGQDRASAQAQIRTALAIARAGGPLPAAESIKDALSTIAQDAGDLFSTYEEKVRDFYQSKADVSDLGNLANGAQSVAEKTLQVLEEQKSTLAAQKEASMLAYQSEITRLDNVVSGAQQSLDVLKGIDTTGLTIVQALEAVRLAIVAAAANPVAGAAAPINDAYKESLGRAPDAAGAEYWQNVIAGGGSITTVVGQIQNSMEAQIQKLYRDLLGRAADAAGLDFFIKSGSSLSDISRNIKESKEYQDRVGGAQAPQAAAMSTGDNGGQAFVNRASNDRIEVLLQQLVATSEAGTGHMEQLADNIDRVTAGGNAMAVETN